MENIVMILIMVIASITVNPFLSAEEVKPVKPIAAAADEQDDTAEETDDDAIVMVEDETESN